MPSAVMTIVDVNSAERVEVAESRVARQIDGYQVEAR